jgi:Calcineurin-like phosphoesterase
MTRLSKSQTPLTLLAAAIFLSGAHVASFGQDAEDPDELLGVLLVVGDIARCGDAARHKKDEDVAEVVKSTVAEAKGQGVPVRLILLGDLAYPHGATEDLKNCFDPNWGELKDIMLPVPGNHDYDLKKDGKYDKVHGDANAEPYFDYFREEPKDSLGNALVSAEGERAGYYSLKFPDATQGPWFLLALNPYTKANVGPGWEAWVKEELVSNEQLGPDKSSCIVAFTHPFRFSSGYHGHAGNKKNPDAKPVKGGTIKSAYRVLMDHRASLLLSGHDHHFEQFGRQDVDGNPTEDGIRSFIVGTGGGSPYLQNIDIKYNVQAPNQEHLIGDKFGVLKLDLYKDKYAWTFLPTDGQPIQPEVHEDSCNSK